MRNIISFLLLLCTVQAVMAQEGIKFETTPFKDILAKAKAENKLVFLDAMAVWCGPCKMMEKNVFPVKSVADYYNTNFVNARFDMEKGEGRDIAKTYGVSSYPTYLFINGDGQLVTRNYGYMSPSTFVEVGKEANSAVSNNESMRERFDKGEKNPEFLANIIRLNVRTDYEFAKLASERYFENKKTKEFTTDEIAFLAQFIRTSKDKNFKVFKDNKAELIKIIPEKSYDDFINQITLNEIRENAVDKDNKKIRDDYFMAGATPVLGAEEARKQLLLLKLGFYEHENNFPEFEKAALEYFKDSETSDPNHLLKAATLFADKATSTESLKTAQKWIERMQMMRGESADSSFTLARLYNKTGQKAEAKMFAELALSLAQKNSSDTTAIETFLKQFP